MTRYRHDYHQSFVYKVILHRKKDAAPSVTLEDVLEAVRRIHVATCGLKQIVYLVGWQFDGHDSKYPAWSEVNRTLRRPGDAAAHESLLWLIESARAYNAVISLHINMDDAYENSPLWETYLKADVLAKHADGSLIRGEVWDGEQAYLVNKAREWEVGLAQRRIDALAELLPLGELGTIHIDNFMPRLSFYHDVTFERDLGAMKQIIGHWQAHGVDVTTEYLSDHELIGLIPMLWHFNMDEADRLAYPPDLVCGGGSSWNQRRAAFRDPEVKFGMFMMPQAGCLFEAAWGHSTDADLTDPNTRALLESFYLNTLPWHLLNRHRAERHIHTSESYEVHFSGGVKTSVRTHDQHLTLSQNNRVLLDGTDLCIPAPWHGDTCIAYSKHGCDRQWQLPEGWDELVRVFIRNLNDETAPVKEVNIATGWIYLSLVPGSAVDISPKLPTHRPPQGKALEERRA